LQNTETDWVFKGKGSIFLVAAKHFNSQLIAFVILQLTVFGELQWRMAGLSIDSR